MESLVASGAFAALASPARLRIFRLLVAAGPDGVRSGEVAEAIQAPANTTSNHLAVLTRAGLATPRRDSRSIYYAADYGAIRDLLAFLMEDCCGGRAEICAPMIEVAQRACCAPEGRA
jgi:DNA-binding transcriptional ArsR family regulator